jgi:fatty acid desaturase
MQQDQIAELNKRITSLQRAVARAHNSLIYCAAFAALTGLATALLAAHFLGWPKWAIGVGLLAYMGATNLIAAKQIERDSPDDLD